MTSPLNNLTDTWNNAGTVFTGLKYNITNTASAAGSRFFDFQIGGSTFFNFDANTRIYNINDTYTNASNYRGVFMGFDAAHSNTFIITAQAAGTGAPAGPIRLSGTGGVYFWDTQFGEAGAGMNNIGSNVSRFYADQFCVDFANSDTILARDAAYTLALRNSTHANTFRVYNTYTDASNYERGVFDWGTTTNTLTIGVQNLGSGSVRGLNIVGGHGTTFLCTTTEMFGCYDTFIDAANKVGLGSGTVLGFSSSGSSGGTVDVCVSRSAAGVIAFGNSAGVGNSAACIVAKTKAGAFTTSDVPASSWVVGRDTSGATTKLYYNNAGTLMTVALT